MYNMLESSVSSSEIGEYNLTNIENMPAGAQEEPLASEDGANAGDKRYIPKASPQVRDCCLALDERISIVDSDGFSMEIKKEETETDGKRSRKRLEFISSYKNIAEGLMDIALLSANANQLRFLITYNHEASTYYISLGLVVLSLTLQVAVGIALIFKRRMQRFSRSNDFIIGGVFMVTVVNILLAAFTTTDNRN